MENLLLITDIPGYSPQISRLVSMMNYVRFTTLNTVKGLTQNQLDFLLDAQSNSIGALLLHCAAIEYCYQVSTFEKRDLDEEENLIWGAALDLGEKGREKIKGSDLSFYITKLEQIRNKTLDLFKSVSDDWLYVEEDFWHGKKANHYFMWFHVFEDEINHRGQMRIIRKRTNAE